MNEINLGIGLPQILLPNESIDLHKWAVIACDQYTSQREYWKRVEALVKEAPSTLRLILPEVYLEEWDKEERINRINSTMEKYLQSAVLKPLPPGFILVHRTLGTGTRQGLMVLVDLEQYDYKDGAQTLIRSTEGTVLDRLPPRIDIRTNASLELPHTMVLIDDPENTVMTAASENLTVHRKLYDFDLMMSGGHITGYLIDDQTSIDRIFDALKRLADPRLFKEKYSTSENNGVLLAAVGDGNHSLAAAKACWEKIKASITPAEAEKHPARYALVELINVHDKALKFEPIHRVLFNVNPNRMLESMTSYYKACGSTLNYGIFDCSDIPSSIFLEHDKNIRLHVQEPINKHDMKDNSQSIIFAAKGKMGYITITNPKSKLAVGTLQAFLDDFLSREKETSIDYIHGDSTAISLGSQENNMAFILPALKKEDLFKTVIFDGVLPRKAFSMGHAHEKRYYLECRKLY